MRLKSYWHRFSFNRQDLRDEGRHWKHGRCWLNFWQLNSEGEKYKTLATVESEWVIPSFSSISFKLIIGGEHQLGVCLELGIFALYLRFKFLPFGWLPYNEYETGFSIHHKAFWLYLWHEWTGYPGDKYHWQHFSFYPLDFFLVLRNTVRKS